jgi:hypothetical protein
VLFRFFAAGVEIVEAFMAALGDRLYVVFDVHVEINRHKDDAEFRDGAARFIELLENEPIVLPDEIREQVRRALEMTRRHSMRDEDIGETATVLYARSRIKVGEDWLVLMGDRYGIDLAEAGETKVPYMNTTDTIVDLVCQGSLTEEQGTTVWELIHGDGSAAGLIRKLDEICPEDEEDDQVGEAPRPPL